MLGVGGLPSGVPPEEEEEEEENAADRGVQVCLYWEMTSRKCLLFGAVGSTVDTRSRRSTGFFQISHFL